LNDVHASTLINRAVVDLEICPPRKSSSDHSLPLGPTCIVYLGVPHTFLHIFRDLVERAGELLLLAQKLHQLLIGLKKDEKRSSAIIHLIGHLQDPLHKIFKGGEASIGYFSVRIFVNRWESKELIHTIGELNHALLKVRHRLNSTRDSQDMAEILRKLRVGELGSDEADAGVFAKVFLADGPSAKLAASCEGCAQAVVQLFVD
jgi:hypothetical protein